MLIKLFKTTTSTIKLPIFRLYRKRFNFVAWNGAKAGASCLQVVHRCVPGENHCMNAFSWSYSPKPLKGFAMIRRWTAKSWRREKCYKDLLSPNWLTRWLQQRRAGSTRWHLDTSLQHDLQRKWRFRALAACGMS